MAESWLICEKEMQCVDCPIRDENAQPCEHAIEVAPVRNGRWIEDHDYLKCPECSVMVKRDFTFFDIGDWNYCPNCGARMDGGVDDAF